VSIQNSPDGSGWKTALAAFFGSYEGNERHFGNAFQCGTVPEKMKGILEMPSINGQQDFPSRRSC